MTDLLDIRMNDGSRHFCSLPAREDWYAVRDHVANLRGASLTEFICDGVTEAWIDFSFQDQSFSINDQFGEYWFFVVEPACPESILKAVMLHWQTLLCPAPA